MKQAKRKILYWSVWLNKLLDVPCEPTAALTMASAVNWLKNQKKGQTVLIILSGGNIDAEALELLKNSEYLNTPPTSIGL